MIKRMRIWNIYVDKGRAPRYIKRLLTNFVINPLLYPIYWLSHLSPRSKRVWVCGIPQKFVWNSKYIFLYANNTRQKGIKVVWISRSREMSRELREKGYPCYFWLSWRGILYPLIAKYHIIDASIETINFWLSGGAKVVLIWHGIPLKHVAHDVKKGLSLDIVLHKTKGIKPVLFRYLLPWRFRQTDYIAVTSSVFRDICSSAFQVPKERIFITGFPKNDILFYEVPGSEVGSDISAVEQLKSLRVAGMFKTILYAPTWRDTGGDSFFESEEKLKELNAFLGQQHMKFFLKLHPLAQAKTFQNAYSVVYEHIVFVRADSDADHLLPHIDILVTDYSGIYFEFLLLDRPIIFFPFDYEKYTTVDRELYFPYEEVTPGPKVKTLQELMKALEQAAHGSRDEYASARKKVRDMCYTYQDGNAAKRFCDTMKRL